MFPVPTSFFLTSGVGVHRERLTAFELALRDADIEQQNLVSVSSILPPRCEQVERENGVGTLRPGEITFCVMARTETDEPGRRIHFEYRTGAPRGPGDVRLHLRASRLWHDARGERRLCRGSRRDHVGIYTGSR